MILQDEDMKFDTKLMRYYLTNDYVTREVTDLKGNMLDNDFSQNPSEDGDLVVKRACDMLWAFIERNSFHKLSTLFYLTHNKQAFERLKIALSMQLERFLQVGDTANAVGMQDKDRFSWGAVDELKSCEAFSQLFRNIPKLEKW